MANTQVDLGTQAQDRTLTAVKVVLGTLTNAEIATNAALAFSKLAALSTGQILVGNAGVVTSATLSGDASISAAGVITVADGVITGTKIALSTVADGNLVTPYTKADGTRPFTGDQSMGGFKLTNVGSPASGNDAANKTYVDNVAQGLDVKASVRVVALTDIVLSGAQTIDGVLLSAGDRVLLAGQTNAVQNGIYIVSATAWSRSSDMAAGSDGSGNFAFVTEGTTNDDTGWVCINSTGAAVVGTNALVFTQFSGAGTGITGSGATGNIPKFTGSAAVGDSIMSEAAGVITVAGDMNVTGSYKVGGTQIAMANLSDESTVLRTNAGRNLLTGNTLTIDPGATLNVAGTLQIAGLGVTATAAELNDVTDSIVVSVAGSVLPPPNFNVSPAVAEQYGVTLVSKDLSSPAVPDASRGVLLLGGVSPNGFAGDSYFVGASGNRFGVGARGTMSMIGGNVLGSDSINSAAHMIISPGKTDFNGGLMFFGAGDSGGRAGANLFLASGDTLGWRSDSGVFAATTVTAGQTLDMEINAVPITIVFTSNLTTGPSIAAEIQNLVRAITPKFLAQFAGGRYFLTAQGDQINSVQGSIFVTGGSAAPALKLGLANGGSEGPGGFASAGTGAINFTLGGGGPFTMQAGTWDAGQGLILLGSPNANQTPDSLLSMHSGNNASKWQFSTNSGTGGFQLSDKNLTGADFNVNAPVVINGDMNVTGVYKVNGVQIAMANLSDESTVLRTNAGRNLLTGNTLTIDPGATLNVAGTLQIAGTGVTATAAELNAVGLFVTRETPAGVQNGTNPTFTLANTPIAGSEMIFRDGMLMDSGAGNDYTISGATITFLGLAIPATLTKVRVSYRHH